MEKRMLLRLTKDAASGRSARVWRITKGVLNSETGQLRIHLYDKGKTVWNPDSLCKDVAHADNVVRLWVRDGIRLWGPNPI